MIKKNSFLYVAICSKKTSPGVFKKINGFVDGANQYKYKAKAKIVNPDGISGNIKFLAKILFAQEEVVMVRYIPKLGLAFIFFGLFLRLKNKVFIIDVPTPLTNHLLEIY